jgi:hypothetical protein
MLTAIILIGIILLGIFINYAANKLDAYMNRDSTLNNNEV